MDEKRVCVIDDEKIVLDSVERILKTEKYSVDRFQESRKGLDAALGGDYDLVLTDIRMPEIGGMKILRDIKRNKPNLPVVIITGYSTVDGAVQAMKLGASEYIEKPFTPDLLLEKVGAVFSKQEPSAEEQTKLVHKDTLLKVLERASADYSFAGKLFYEGADALSEYELTEHEKLAILTGDIAWIESFTGPLSSSKRRWLDQRLSCEIW
jgi:DNA-binding NtrC family response regulator